MDRMPRLEGVSADLFISYAWTSNEHREWVRLLAAHMKAIGYHVLVDADVSYGDDLTGFMALAMESRHVLLVVDENYIERANNLPESGVGIETAHISAVYDTRPAAWLTVLFKENRYHRLPAWLGGRNPKEPSFNTTGGTDLSLGSEQIVGLWRWLEGLPENRDHEMTSARLRERAKRLEAIDRERDPATWSSPALEGEVHFEYERSPGRVFKLGHDDLGFTLAVSGHSEGSVYVLKDPIHSVEINRTGTSTEAELAAQLTPGRSVTPRVGEQAILMNKAGRLCLVDILAVQPERTTPTYVPASIRFWYRVLTDS